MVRFWIVLSVLLLCSPVLAQRDPSEYLTTPRADRPAHAPVIAIADFTGDDAATGRFLADTLLTDLAQSRDMRLVERSELRRAISEQNRQDTGLYEPAEVREIGRMVRADKLLVGSFLIRENQIIINARLLDIATGRVAEGGASNITGDTHDLLAVVHRLAHILHRHITGTELRIDGEGADPPPANAAPRPVPPVPQHSAAAARDNNYRIGGDSTDRGSANQRPSPAPARSDNSYRIRESGGETNNYYFFNPSYQYSPPVYDSSDYYYTPPIVPTYAPSYYPYYPLYGYTYWNYYPYTSFRCFSRSYSPVRFSVNAHLNFSTHQNFNTHRTHFRGR